MRFLQQVLQRFADDRCSTMAAGLAYYTAFALPPLLYLLLAILTFGLSIAYESGQAQLHAEKILRTQASELIGNAALSDEIAALLKDAKLENGKWWKTAISVIGIFVAATGVVAALQDALNQVWSVKPNPERAAWLVTLWKRLISFAMILALGFLLLVSLVLSAILSGLGDQLGSLFGFSEMLVKTANLSVQALVIFAFFTTNFKFMPDVKIGWREVFVGAAATTALFLWGRYLMQLYFELSPPGAHFGSAAASIAILLAWVYYTAMIVLLGAEITQVCSERLGHTARPEPHAVKAVEKFAMKH